MEIERQFLIAAEPDLGGASSVAVRQGYVTRPGDSVSVRLRQKGETFLLTMKSGQGLVRAEQESRIEPALFDTFWPAAGSRKPPGPVRCRAARPSNTTSPREPMRA